MLVQMRMGARVALFGAVVCVALPSCSSQVVEEAAQGSSSGAGGQESSSSSASAGSGGSGASSSVASSSNASSSASAGSGGSGAGPSGDCKPGDPPVALSSAENGPFALAIDADFVYFTTATTNACAPGVAVKRVSKHGGAPEVLGQAVHPLRALAVDATRVYWADDPVSPCTDPADFGFALVTAPKAGGAAPTLSPFAAEFLAPDDLALDDAHVYWVSADTGSVRVAAKLGGNPSILFNGGGAPTAIAVDGANVYWAGSAGLAGEPKAGGNVTTLAPPPVMGGFGGLATAAGDVYFGAWQDCQGADCTWMGAIKRVPTGGGAVVEIANTVDKQPQRLAVDEASVYWTALNAAPPGQLPLGAVLRAPRIGGEAQQIAAGQTPRGIAVDATCVYWTDTGDGTVMKAPK